MAVKQNEKERNELRNLIKEITFDGYNFYVPYGDDKYITGVTSANDEISDLSQLFEIKTVFETIKNLDYKTRYSLYEAIKYTFSKDVYFKFDIFKEGSSNEKKGYYYIENAIFRLSTLWDMLAQLFNIYCGFRKPINSIYVKRFFEQMTFTGEAKEISERINAYLNEENLTEDFPNWKGNNTYISEYRNKMTHRNDPTIPSFSDFDINLKEPIMFLCTRTVLDYVSVSHYIQDFLKIYCGQTEDSENHTNENGL